MEKGVIDQQCHTGDEGNISRIKHYKIKPQDFHNLPWILPRKKIRENCVAQPALNIR